MDYSVKELLDVTQLQELLDTFGEVHGLTTAICDLEGATIAATTAHDFCARFHGSHGDRRDGFLRCVARPDDLFHRSATSTPCRCPFGLMLAALPITLEGCRVGYAVAGHFFLSPPDESFFLQQARSHGLPADDYLAAVRNVPLLSEDKLGKTLDLIGKFAQSLANQGLQDRRKLMAGAALKKSEDYYKAILQTALNGICVLDLQGNLLEVNRAFCENTGYSEEELLSMSIADLEASEVAAEIGARIGQIVANGKASFQTWHRLKDGAVIDVEVNVQYLPAHGGQLIACLRDITQRKRADAVLQESRAKLHAAMANMTDGFYISDTTGNLIDFNDAFATFHRFSSKADCPTRLAEFPAIVDVFLPDGAFVPLEKRPVMCALRGETASNVEYTLRHKSSGETWSGSYSYSPVRNNDGEVGGAVVVVRDITEQKRLEAYRAMGQDILLILGGKESLQQAIERIIGKLKTTIGIEAVGIRLQDGDDFPYFYQEGFPQEFLHKENSLLTRNRDGGVCRDDAGDICLDCTCGMVICGKTDPASPWFTKGGSCWTNDAQADGSTAADELKRTNPRDECIHQGYSSVALIPIRAKGRNVGLLQLNDRHPGCFSPEIVKTLEGIAENIGEAMLRKQAEEKLVANERFLRALTDQLPGMVVYWDRDLRCCFVNRGCLDWFRTMPEPLIGARIDDLISDDLFRPNEPYIRAALEGKPQQFERELTKPDGETRYTWFQYIPDVVDGVARGCLVLVSDVTELKMAEREKARLEAQLQQAHKMESIGRLAGGVAHDFNNMLSVILGHAELALMRMDPSDPVVSSIDEIILAADRSADLTRQLLAFARKQTISPKVVKLNDVIPTMLSMLQRLIGENVDLRWRPGDDLWEVMIDPSQLDQIMANLCVNARDAITDTGVVRIETANCPIDDPAVVQRQAVPANHVKIIVSDDGEGMSKEMLENIFEPFFTTKKVGEGTGLGLATVYGIVSQNNGFIDVVSEEGGGTTFTIYLPRYQREEGEPEAEVAPDSVQQGSQTILLVEDEPAILEITTLILTELGYTLLAAGTPAEALSKAREHAGEIDVVITDVIMPEMNGRELVNAISAIHPHIKYLFMSGYTADILANHGVHGDGLHFIQKPFKFGDLAAKLQEVLES